MHVQWHPPKWRASIILFLWRPPLHAQLVQGHEDHHLRVQFVAQRRVRSPFPVPRFLLPPWPHWLLLPVHSLFTARFHFSKVTASRAGQVSQPPMWLLPKIPLRTEFYQTILGGGKALLSGGRVHSNNCGDGEDSHTMPWWCLSLSHSVVSPASSPFLFLLILIFSSFANQSMHFILAYHARLSGAQAMWANWQYVTPLYLSSVHALLTCLILLVLWPLTIYVYYWPIYPHYQTHFGLGRYLDT